jgi:hypothetical protein
MYQWIVKGLGSFAALGGVAYGMAVVLAAADGSRRGIEVPYHLTGFVLTILGLSAALSAGAWLGDRANRISAVRDIEPVVARLLDTQLAEIVRAMNGTMTGGPMRDQLDLALDRARSYGQAVEVQSRLASGPHANGGASTSILPMRRDP